MPVVDDLRKHGAHLTQERDYSTVLGVLTLAETDEDLGNPWDDRTFSVRVTTALDTDPSNFCTATKQAVTKFLASPPRSQNILREQIRAMVAHEAATAVNAGHAVVASHRIG